MSGVDDIQTGRKTHKAPYTPHHPIPTVQKYREEKQNRQERYGTAGDGEPEGKKEDEGMLDRLGDAYTTLRHGKEAANPSEETQPFEMENKNIEPRDDEVADDHAGRAGERLDTQSDKDDGEAKNDETAEDTTEGMLAETQDPKKARKAMKKFSANGQEREVTDPVTHLPIQIHDFTDKDLKKTTKNPPPAGAEPKSATGGANRNKDDEELEREGQESQDSYQAMQPLFPPPEFQTTRDDITDVYRKALSAGIGVVGGSLSLVVALFHVTRNSTGISRTIFTTLEVITCLGVTVAVIVGMRQYTENRIKNVWETEVWQAERQQGRKLAKTHTAESAQWLNSLLAAVWPLVNPDLFTSISDTLEVSSAQM